MANRNDEVREAVSDGVSSIEKILSATAIKDKAKADIDTEKDKKHEEITNNSESTTEEKAALIKN
ncbi:DUF1542 domain-containing protein [Staphylococcus saccharolyticus]|uniref:DUF1542 domain-containing protein n=1 Tax=Staphylococcus saccharolyticus TaxID=33028 RepID=UPI0032DF985B